MTTTDKLKQVYEWLDNLEGYSLERARVKSLLEASQEIVKRIDELDDLGDGDYVAEAVTVYKELLR